MKRLAYAFELKDEDNKNTNDCKKIGKQGKLQYFRQRGQKREGERY